MNDDDTKNPNSSDLNEGLGDDAYSTYDIDDATLPGEPTEEGSDETETGMASVDADNLTPDMDSMGDVIMNPEDSVE